LRSLSYEEARRRRRAPAHRPRLPDVLGGRHGRAGAFARSGGHRPSRRNASTAAAHQCAGPPAGPRRNRPSASPRLALPHSIQLPALVGRYFEANVGRRLYIQVDKPLHKPGETIWFKAWDLVAGTLAAPGGAEPKPALVELVSPKGAVVLKKRIRAATGGAAGAGASPPSSSGGTTNDFELPAEAQGGEYTLRATTADGQRAERAIIVSAYKAPRLKKKLEFVKKAYGAGDLVSATVEVKRPTGEPLANKELAAVVTVDGVELPRIKFTSNAEGSALVKFELPKTIAAGDGLLTILVEDGSVTESISNSIPILQKRLALAFFPEGGQLVAGLPTRLYFKAKTPLGKPADVEGRIVDDLGNTVATFGSHKNGLGRLEFTPATGRSYGAVVMRPAGVDERYALPLAEASGCVPRSYDDLAGGAYGNNGATRDATSAARPRPPTKG